MPEYLYPGVYIEEVPPSARPICWSWNKHGWVHWCGHGRRGNAIKTGQRNREIPYSPSGQASTRYWLGTVQKQFR